VSGRGTRPQHTAATEGVLQLCADGFDGFASAAGIPQIDLTAIEVSGLLCGERQSHDGSAQLELLETMADVIEDGGSMTSGGTQTQGERLLTSTIEPEGDVDLGDGLTASDQARGEIANHGTDDEDKGLQFGDGRGKDLCDAERTFFCPRRYSWGLGVSAGEGMPCHDTGSESTGELGGRDLCKLADGVNA